MASLVKAYSFTPNTIADPAQVNTDFDDLVAFVNGSLVHVDGTTPFTGLPSLPAVDPTLDNQPARKRYTDLTAKLKTSTVVSKAPAANRSITGDETWVYWPQAGDQVSTSISKQHASTLLLVSLTGTAFTTDPFSSFDFGVRINSVDIKLGDFLFGAGPAAHHAWGGDLAISGIAVGSWVVTLRVNVNGGDNLSCDLNDWYSLSVREVW